MRGSQALFQDFFEADAVPAETACKRKGRSAELHSQRNECLIERYYFYGKYTDKRYLSILETISREFFISIVTIPDLIQDNYDVLDSLRKTQPARTYFSKKWPHLVW